MFRPKFTISTVYCKNKNTIKLNLDTRIIITSTQDNVGKKNTKQKSTIYQWFVSAIERRNIYSIPYSKQESQYILEDYYSIELIY